MANTPSSGSETKKDPVEVSFVLPCFNEAATIEACIHECVGALRSAGVAGEVVVADNGSTDGSPEIAARAGARVIVVARRGYGSALMAGIRDAQGKYVVMGDSDMSYDFSQLPRFLEKLRQGHGLVMGCRMAHGGGTIMPGAMPFLHRWLGNPMLSALGRVLFRTGIIDFHCGMRAFDREKLLALGLRTPGMEFASEMVVKASLAKFRIAQVPVTLRPDGRNRPPHLRTWQDGWRHLRFMLLHVPRWLFLYPGLATMVLSAVAFAILLSGPVTLGGIRFDTNTLLVCGVGMTAGFQVTLMGLFSEIYSRSTGLLPPSKLASRLLKANLFEKGLLIGGPLLAGGAACLFLALGKWKHAGFGDLTYPDTLRLIIPSVTGMSLGIQIMFGGFLLAVLGVNADPD
jgi:glycosyltransferase involved in cell wall biosynthesis